MREREEKKKEKDRYIQGRKEKKKEKDKDLFYRENKKAESSIERHKKKKRNNWKKVKGKTIEN